MTILHQISLELIIAKSTKIIKKELPNYIPSKIKPFKVNGWLDSSKSNLSLSSTFRSIKIKYNIILTRKCYRFNDFKSLFSVFCMDLRTHSLTKQPWWRIERVKALSTFTLRCMVLYRKCACDHEHLFNKSEGENVVVVVISISVTGISFIISYSFINFL